MPSALVAVDEVRQALAEHFDRSAQPLRIEQIVETTALDSDAVANALAVLKNKGEIEGTGPAELSYPIIVTSYRYP